MRGSFGWRRGRREDNDKVLERTPATHLLLNRSVWCETHVSFCPFRCSNPSAGCKSADTIPARIIHMYDIAFLRHAAKSQSLARLACLLILPT